MQPDSVKKTLQNLIELGLGDYIGGMLGALTILLITIFHKQIKKIIDSLFNSWKISNGLKQYKKNLELETIRVNHVWQTNNLLDIFIPINIESNTDEKRETIYIHDYLPTFFQEKSNLILIGNAGSGKTVAMGFIARESWNANFIPVLLRFSEINRININDIRKNIENVLLKNKLCMVADATLLEDFINENLQKGKFIFLFDGFDELTKKDRFTVWEAIESFFRINHKCKYIISCRISVWLQHGNLIRDFKFDNVTMQDFSLYDVQSYIHKQISNNYEESSKLIDIIKSNSYLQDLCKNPLMLTIITFLYSRENRVIPSNKVDFYKECILALVDKWDETKGVFRNQHFGMYEKMEILALIAYKHLTLVNDPSSEISLKSVIQCIKEYQANTQVFFSDIDKILFEIIDKTDILIKVDSDSIVFVHRTIVEYLCAIYILENNQLKNLISLFQADPGKWEETVSLFYALNNKEEDLEFIFASCLELAQNEELFNQCMSFMLRLISENDSSKLNIKFCHQLITNIEISLRKKFYHKFIFYLSAIAKNHNSLLGSSAYEILIKSTNIPLLNKDLQYLIVTLVEFPDPSISKIVEKYFTQLDLKRIFSEMTFNLEPLVLKFLEFAEEEKIIQILNGIKNANNIQLLARLMFSHTNEKVQFLSAEELSTYSSNNSFLAILENILFQPTNLVFKSEIIKKYNEWEWPNIKDKNFKNGHLIFFSIALLKSKFIPIQDSYSKLDDFFSRNMFKELLNFLALAFSTENKHIVNVTDNNYYNFPTFVSYKGMKYIWKNLGKGLSTFFFLICNFIIQLTIWLFLFISFSLTTTPNLILLIFFSISLLLFATSIILDKKISINLSNYGISFAAILSPIFSVPIIFFMMDFQRVETYTTDLFKEFRTLNKVGIKKTTNIKLKLMHIFKTIRELVSFKHAGDTFLTFYIIISTCLWSFYIIFSTTDILYKCIYFTSLLYTPIYSYASHHMLYWTVLFFPSYRDRFKNYP